MILVAARDWGKSIAIHEIAPNLAFVAAPVLTEVLLNWCAWRGILAWIGAASVIAGLLFLALGRGGQFRGEVPNPANLRLLFSEPGFWIMVILFGLGIGASLGVYNMLPLFLVAEHGFDRSWVNTLIAVSRIFCLGVALLAGWATDRIGPKRALLIVFVTTGVTTMLLGVLRGGWIIMAVFIQATLAVCFFPAGFAALSIVVPVKVRNIAVSLAVPAGSLIGGGAIPAGIGILAEEGSFAFGFVLAGAMILMGSLLVGYLEAGTLRYDRGES
jgi:NNP family nitrate/nitrite transporter-like MFS transporter